MGNMGGGVEIYPLDAETSGGNNQSITNMGQSTLLLYSMLGNDHHYSQVRLRWNGAELDFDPTPPVSTGGPCVLAGTATAGAVIYVQCFFDC